MEAPCMFIIRPYTNRYFIYLLTGNEVVLLVMHRTCDLQVTGSSPGWALLCSGLGQATYTCMPLVTKQYNLVPAKGMISLAGKVTTGLMDSNSSLPPGLMSPAAWLPRNRDQICAQPSYGTTLFIFCLLTMVTWKASRHSSLSNSMNQHSSMHWQRPVLSVRCISLYSAAFSLATFERWLFNSFWLVKFERCKFNSVFVAGLPSIAFDRGTLCTRQTFCDNM